MPENVVKLDDVELTTENKDRKKPGRKPKSQTDNVDQKYVKDVEVTELESVQEVAVHAVRGAKVPHYATDGSSCFDFRVNLEGLETVESWTSSNKKNEMQIRNNNGILSIILQPGSRAVIPTGLHFDLPEDHELLIFARSGRSLKDGLVLANGVGVVDSDYTDEVCVLLMNMGENRIEIVHDERVAQGRIQKVERVSLVAGDMPKVKGNRKGGMGSTGVK